MTVQKIRERREMYGLTDKEIAEMIVDRDRRIARMDATILEYQHYWRE